jgi:hypothetical protein
VTVGLEKGVQAVNAVTGCQRLPRSPSGSMKKSGALSEGVERVQPGRLCPMNAY